MADIWANYGLKYNQTQVYVASSVYMYTFLLARLQNITVGHQTIVC